MFKQRTVNKVFKIEPLRPEIRVNLSVVFIAPHHKAAHYEDVNGYANCGADRHAADVFQSEVMYDVFRALAWGIAPEALAEANNMGMNDILREGRALKMPIRE